MARLSYDGLAYGYETGDYSIAEQAWMTAINSAFGNYLMFLNDGINIVTTLGTYPVIKNLPGFIGLIKTIWEMDQNIWSAQGHYFKFQQGFKDLSAMGGDPANFLESYFHESLTEIGFYDQAIMEGHEAITQIDQMIQVAEAKGDFQSANKLRELRKKINDLINALERRKSQIEQVRTDIANYLCVHKNKSNFCNFKAGLSVGGGFFGGGGGIPPTSPGGDHPDDYAGVLSYNIRPEDAGDRIFLGHYQRLVEKTNYSTDYLEYRRLLNISLEDGNLTVDELDALLAVSSKLARDVKEASNTALLSNGYFDTTKALLGTMTYYAEYSADEFSPAIVDHSRVLIVPTGGLYGLDSSPLFKAKLEKYVSEGGTLVVFAQQHGYEFQALPGGEVTGYGWLEDQSCFFRAVHIDTYHPVLAGQDSVLMDINIDGYFTKWPENATILFSRTANGMPAGIMYHYGNGTVIATTAYTDWAFAHGQRTRDGLAFVRDLLAWAVAEAEGTQVQEYGHGDTVSIDIPITNNADSAAVDVAVNIRAIGNPLISPWNREIAFSRGI
jgi:hypothetical protein